MSVGLLQGGSLALFPYVLDQRGMDLDRNGGAVIIAGLDTECGGLTGLIDVLIRLDVDEETAVRGHDGRGAGDFPIGGVGDASFNSIAHVPIPLIDLGRN